MATIDPTDAVSDEHQRRLCQWRRMAAPVMNDLGQPSLRHFFETRAAVLGTVYYGHTDIQDDLRSKMGCVDDWIFRFLQSAFDWAATFKDAPAAQYREEIGKIDDLMVLHPDFQAHLSEGDRIMLEVWKNSGVTPNTFAATP